MRRRIDLDRVNRAVAALVLSPAVWKTCPWEPRGLIDTGLRQWLRCAGAALRDDVVIGMPSRAVDEAWHGLILCTARYAAFCDAAYGRFLHHHPDGDGDGDSMRDQLSRTVIAWGMVARAGRGVRPLGPRRAGRRRGAMGCAARRRGGTVVKVVALYRFPVKAMAGEALASAQLGWAGLDGDRRHAFVQSDDRSDFPWLTIRQVPALTTYVPAIRNGGVVIRTPAGRELDVASPELAGELSAYGRPVHLLHSKRGLFDAFPVSILSLQTVAAVSALAGRDLDPLRFRPNIVIDAPGHDFPEEAWLGREVRIGDARIRVDVRDTRCMVINFDPHTAERDPAVLRAVAQHRETCAAVYGSCVAPGEIRVGDQVRGA